MTFSNLLAIKLVETAYIRIPVKLVAWVRPKSQFSTNLVYLLKYLNTGVLNTQIEVSRETPKTDLYLTISFTQHFPIVGVDQTKRIRKIVLYRHL